MTIQPAALFAARWDAFWCTTFSFELELFDEYLFRRLGDPPLNATVLVDFRSLAKVWARIGPGDEWRARRVNQLYLVRGVSQEGSFHPKTYFFANDKEGTLLVGSGNLSLSGLEEGKELFVRFDSSDRDGLAAILSWRDWIGGIVEQADDQLLGQRWFRLRQATSGWLKGRAGSSGFVTNVDTSLLDQLLADTSDADELHVTAPFFDSDVEAFGSLIQRSHPKMVSVYLGRGTSVDGSALATLLKASNAKVRLYSFDPPRFVHAKLIAIVKGKNARVLSGSANLSRAALTSSHREQTWANTEAGVLSSTTAASARDLFHPPDLIPKRLALSALADYSMSSEEQPLPMPLRLLFARPTDDRRIEASFLGEPPNPLYLESRSGTSRMDGSRTEEPVHMGEASALVWLADQDGEPVSNRVPLDDPDALERQLDKPSGKTTDRPRGLDALDLQNPIAQILVRLHDEFIFDVDELDSVKQAERATEGDAADVDDSGFWERLAKEELALDPRVGAYRRHGDRAPFDEDRILLLLRMMLDRTPEERARLSASEGPGADEGERTAGTKWTVTQRLQTRLMNVLTRWGRALADPRMNWIHPFASVLNFQALVYAVAELWERDALPKRKLEQVAGLLFGSFVRSESGDGYLFLLNSEERAAAIGQLPPEARGVATALAYLGLRPRSDWEAFIFEWQVWLRPCLEMGIVEATNEAAKLASRVAGEQVTPAALVTRLSWARDYIDDPRWCLEMARTCGLQEVSFSRQRFALELALEVRAHTDLVDDPGVVRLIRHALDFRRADGLVVMSGDERISIRLGESAVARLKDGRVLESEDPITLEDLALLDSAGLPLRERLDLPEESAAS